VPLLAGALIVRGECGTPQLRLPAVVGSLAVQTAIRVEWGLAVYAETFGWWRHLKRRALWATSGVEKTPFTELLICTSLGPFVCGAREDCRLGCAPFVCGAREECRLGCAVSGFARDCWLRSFKNLSFHSYKGLAQGKLALH
jgi:hypothetical protein